MGKSYSTPDISDSEGRYSAMDRRRFFTPRLSPGRRSDIERRDNQDRRIRNDQRNVSCLRKQMRVFNYKGILIRYRDTGEGRPFILLHGFGGSSYSWRYLAPFFSKTHRVILIDLKGFGLSDKPLDDAYSLADQCAIIKQFIKENDFKNLILGGNSYGGEIALRTFLDLQEQGTNPIVKLIVIDSPPYYEENIIGRELLEIPLLKKIVRRILPKESIVKFVLTNAFHDVSKISREDIRTYASHLNHPGSHHALLETAKRLIHPINDGYKDINIPVLIIWGEKDKISPLSNGEKLSKIIPKSTFVTIRNCGHMPQEECPKETIDIISRFIED